MDLEEAKSTIQFSKEEELKTDQALEEAAENEKVRQEEADKIKAEEARIAEERAKIQAEQEEEKRQKLISELIEKIAQNPQNISALESSIAKTYDDFTHNEEKAKVLCKRFGIPYIGTISSTNAKQLIEQIHTNMQEINSNIEESSVNSEMSFEGAKQSSDTLIPLLDGVTYGTEIAKTFPELITLNKQQIDANAKKAIYGRVQTAMQAAKIQKYMEEKVSVRDEKISFWGRISGKEQLKEQRLKNLDLKIQLAQLEISQPQDGYSIRQLLADMHICADTELDGEFTPEMQELYEAIKTTFHDKRSEEFSESYIRQIASQKQRTNEKSGLPVVQNSKPRIFGKTRAQTELIELENQSLKQKILKIRTTNATKKMHANQEQDAVALFEQKLREIAVNTQERDIQKLRNRIETTFDLCGNRED